MPTDLVQIRRMGELKRAENERFRKHLKRHSMADRRIRRIAEQIEEQFDCTECANCCRVASCRITERDVERLAKALRIPTNRFLAEYAEQSADEGWVLRRNEAGCVFLDGNSCLVYESRPHICEGFPHTVKGDGSFVARMWDMPDRATYCPIVYETLEALKLETRFRG